MPSVSVQKKAGNYYAVWYDPGRQPKQVWRTLRTKDRRIARQRATQQERDVAYGLYDPWTEQRREQGLTLKEAVDRYLASRDRVDRPSTIAEKRSRLRSFRRFMPANMSVGAILSSDVRSYLQSLEGRRGGSAAPSTRQNHYNTLSAMFGWLLEEGYVQANPVADVDRPHVPDSSYHVLSPSEIERIQDAIVVDCEQHARRKRLYMVDVIDLAVSSGLRLGEICALNWGHVTISQGGDVPAAKVTVTGYWSSKANQARFTKTGKRRTLPVFARGAQVLHKLRCSSVQANDRPPRGDEPVFRAPQGGRVIPSTVSKFFRYYVDEAKIGAYATFHDLRHTYISWLVNELGVPVSVVQQLAGHAEVEQTLSYVHVSQENLDQSIDRVLYMAGIQSERPPVSTSYVEIARWLSMRNMDDREAEIRT